MVRYAPRTANPYTFTVTVLRVLRLSPSALISSRTRPCAATRRGRAQGRLPPLVAWRLKLKVGILEICLDPRGVCVLPTLKRSHRRRIAVLTANRITAARPTRRGASRRFAVRS